MRHACGLKAVDPMVKNKNEFMGITITGSQDEDLLDEEAKQLPIFSKDIMLDLLTKKDKMNKSGLTLMKDMPASAPRMCRQKIYEQLIQKQLWMVAIGRQKHQEVIMPVIATGHGVDVLFPSISLSDTAREYPEQWNVGRFMQRTSGNAARKMNADLLIEIVQEMKKNVRKTKGKPTASEADRIAELAHLLEQKINAEKTLERMSESLDALLETTHTQRKRMRGKSNSAEFDTASQGEVQETLHFIQRKMTYRYKHSFRGRKILHDNIGVAALPRRMQEALCGEETFDLDIINLLFSILPQMLSRLKLVDQDCFAAEFDVLSLLSEQRDRIIRDDLQLPKEKGKVLLAKVACGGSIAPPFETCDLLLKVQRAGRMFRWLACSIQPEVYAEAALTKGFAEASCFAYLWNAVEDYICSTWVDFILQEEVRHLSLHFDGVRVDKQRCGGDEGVEEFLLKSAQHIQQVTHYHVDLAVKRHYFFLQMIIKVGQSSNLDTEDVLLQRGNCIYAALFHLRVERCQILPILARSHPINAATLKTGFRCYRDVCRDLGISLSPTLDRNFEMEKKYLLHLEGEGNPHCVGIEYVKDGLVIVYHLTKAFSMSIPELETALSSAMDESTAVLFEIGSESSPEMDPLLDCMAGAGCSDDVDAMNLFAINVEDDSAEEEVDAVELCDDGASVNVCKHLKDLLKLEVDSYATKLRKSCGTECILCPFKIIKTRKSRDLQNHLQRNHTSKSTWVASGTKQMKVILALYDSDTFNHCKQANYLHRSSLLMRVSIGKPLYESNNKEFDRSIVLLLDGDGPKYVNVSSIGVNIMARRVGHTYYTKTFAEILLRESIVHHGRVKTFLPRLMMRGIEAGNEIIHLFPRKVTIYI